MEGSQSERKQKTLSIVFVYIDLAKAKREAFLYNTLLLHKSKTKLYSTDVKTTTTKKKIINQICLQ